MFILESAYYQQLLTVEEKEAGWSEVGVGDMTKFLYHDDNIYHDIVICFLLKRLLY